MLSHRKVEGLRVNAEKKVVIRNSDIEFSLVHSPSQGKKLQWGEAVLWQASVKNAGQETLRNGVVSLALSGDQFWQANSLETGGGSWEAGHIIWDSKDTNELAELAPGQKLTLSFGFTLVKEPPSLTLPIADGGAEASFNILASGHFSAETTEGNIEARSGEVLVKIMANIDLASRITYQSGPHPPLPGQETIYVAEWLVGPSTGQLSSVRLSVTLPKDITWRQVIESSRGELGYSEGHRLVYWQASKLEKLEKPAAIRFLIGIIPSEEVTNDLVLLPASHLTGRDDSSGETLELYVPAVRLGDVK
jgi:hypothetical protein